MLISLPPLQPVCQLANSENMNHFLLYEAEKKAFGATATSTWDVKSIQ